MKRLFCVFVLLAAACGSSSHINGTSTACTGGACSDPDSGQTIQPQSDAGVEYIPPDATDGGSSAVGFADGAVSSGTFAIKQPSDSVVAYQIDIAHSGEQTGDSLMPPLSQKWSVDLKGAVSYPLLVAGRIFVTFRSATGPSLVALAAADGKTLWGPNALGGTYGWATAAYGDGRVYAINTDGVLSAYDAATGARGWSTTLKDQYSFSSPPTAAGGMVFVGGAGSGGTVYGVAARSTLPTTLASS